MRTLCNHGAIRRSLLIGVTWALVESAGAQELLLPPATAESAGSVPWSAGDPAAVVGPSLANDYLEPVPSVVPDEFTAALPGSECNSCNDGRAPGFSGFYNRCGCDTPLFPWFTGPGNCDNWCVGPHWNVEVDGMFIHRDDAEWGDIGAVTDVVDQFDYGPGVRLFATGYNYSNYGVQIGYEGVNDFHSTAVISTTNELRYESTLNSLEINILKRSRFPIRPFGGFRYVEIDEQLLNIELGVDSEGTFVENRLIGFQVGALRDAWQLNRWVTIEPFGNAGVYLNDFKREDVDELFATGAQTADTREFSEIAYLGELGVTSVLRINACLAVRGGYQIMAFHGVSNALETSLAANGGFDPDTLIYHGARFGIEYQR